SGCSDTNRNPLSIPTRRSSDLDRDLAKAEERAQQIDFAMIDAIGQPTVGVSGVGGLRRAGRYQKKRDSGNNRETGHGAIMATVRSEEHTSELQSRENLVCRLLL